MRGLKAVIFDMDGTLTQPYIDWKALRARIHCPLDKTIIQHIDSLPPDQSARANAILLETEREAAENAAINDGAVELVNVLRQRDLKLALVTNNHAEAMNVVLKRYRLTFDAAFSRDDGSIKPEPFLIQKALEALGVLPHEAIGIGDSHYDLMACEAAQVRCIYLHHGSSNHDHTPSVATLYDVLPLLTDS